MARILLVEDDEMNRDMLSRRLQRKGFEVLVATDGRAAVSMAETTLPDLILMDMSLPELSGLEATGAIRSIPAAQSIPIIALTAHAMESDRQRALQAGCDDYDTKPVDLQRLLEKMNALLASQAAQATNNFR